MAYSKNYVLAWYRQIDNAKGAHEVVGILRDYIANWSPGEIARLPEACRPGRLRDEQDVELLHAQLVEAYRETRETGENLIALQEMTGMVVRASIRIAEVGDGSDSGGGSSGDPLQAQAPGPQ
jgi:hypothetical protein